MYILDDSIRTLPESHGLFFSGPFQLLYLVFRYVIPGPDARPVQDGEPLSFIVDEVIFGIEAGYPYLFYCKTCLKYHVIPNVTLWSRYMRLSNYVMALWEGLDNGDVRENSH